MRVRGFTLIELITVVAVIALLAFVIIVSQSTARLKARDAGRIADLVLVQLALEQYFQANRRYPNPEPQGYCGLATQLLRFLPVLPRDPGDTGAGCSAASKYEYYADTQLAPQQWLLRQATFEAASALKREFSEDIDGANKPAGGGGWIGGALSATCTFTAPSTWSCPTVDCGSAASDSIYCVTSQ